MNSAEPIAHSDETDLFESNKSQEVSFNNLTLQDPGSKLQKHIFSGICTDCLNSSFLRI